MAGAGCADGLGGRGGAPPPRGGLLLSPAVWVPVRSQCPRRDDLEEVFWAVTFPEAVTTLRVTVGTQVGVCWLDTLIAPSTLSGRVGQRPGGRQGCPSSDVSEPLARPFASAPQSWLCFIPLPQSVWVLVRHLLRSRPGQWTEPAGVRRTPVCGAFPPP